MPGPVDRPAKICAVIVTYNPAGEIVQVMAEAAQQAYALVVVDNSPATETQQKMTSDFQAMCASLSSARRETLQIVTNGRNLGLATGLNQGVDRARALGCDIVVFLDQDSLLEPECLKRLAEPFRVVDEAVSIGATAATNVDENEYLVEQFHVSYAKRRHAFSNSFVQEVFWAKTSGTMIPLSVFDKIGMFLDDYFVDEIDHEYNFRMRAAGYHVLWVPEARIVHRLGVPIRAGIGSLRIAIPSHPPWRSYYAVRNLLDIVRRYWRTFSMDVLAHVTFAISLTCVTLVFSDEKSKGVRFVVRGVLDFVAGRMGELVQTNRAPQA